jgi:hypothetical protein
VIGYRLYSLHPAGQIETAQDMLARDDAAAKAMAASIHGNARWELWSGPRLVGQSDTEPLQEAEN